MALWALPGQSRFSLWHAEVPGQGPGEIALSLGIALDAVSEILPVQHPAASCGKTRPGNPRTLLNEVPVLHHEPATLMSSRRLNVRDQLRDRNRVAGAITQDVVMPS